MKTIILTVLLFAVYPLICRADSLELISTEISESYDIHFVSPDHGYICGLGGIYASYDAGQSWSLSYGNANSQDTNCSIIDFDFLPNGTAYAVGWRGVRINDTLWAFSGLVIKSTDSGAGWFDVMTSTVGSFSLDEWQRIAASMIRLSVFGSLS